jgi:hypothetical protein
MWSREFRRWYGLGLASVLAGASLAAQNPADTTPPAAHNGEAAEAVVEERGSAYFFEGRLTRMDSRLAPTLREGLVFSGIFALDETVEAVDEDNALEVARYAGAIVDGDFVFDLNHVVAYSGDWREDRSWLTLQRGDPEDEQSRDAYGVTLPVDGEPIGEEAFEPRWLQLWLMGESGKFLPHLDIQLPPEEVAQAWFRLTFSTDGGEQVFAEGPLEWVGLDGSELSATEQIAQLQGIITELSDRLDRAERESSRLREELLKAESRIRGLNQTLDALLVERQALKDEVARVEALSEPAEDLQNRIATLEAEKVLIEESRDAMGTINEQLSNTLRDREGDLAAARREIIRLEEKLAADAAGEPMLAEPVPDSPHPYLAPGHLRSGGVTESTRPVTPPPPEPASADPVTGPVVPPPNFAGPPPTRAATSAAPDGGDTSSDLPRPRKFRGRR